MGLGPNCFLEAQYLMAIITAKEVYIEHILLIEIRETDKALNDTPKNWILENWILLCEIIGLLLQKL